MLLTHGQPAAHVRTEQQQPVQQQQQPEQQENVSSQQQQQQAASHQDIPAGVAMGDGAQAGQATANLPSWDSPDSDAKQAHSSQQESHVSASHVSQSIDSSESHGLAALQEVSDEQQSGQVHVTGSHMEADQARSQVANQTLPRQSELQQGADKPRYATLPAEPDQDMPAGDLHKVGMSAGKLTCATSTKPGQAMPAVEPEQAMSLDQPRQDIQLSQDLSRGKLAQKLSGEARQKLSDEARAHALKPTGAVSSPELVTKPPPQGRRRRLWKASAQVLPQQLQQSEQQLLYEGEAELQQPGKQPRQRQATQQQQQQQGTKLVDCMLNGVQQANQLSRAGSREASAVPVESQQSAVHAVAHDSQIQSAQALKKKAQQSAVHALAHDSQIQSAQALKRKAQDFEPNAPASGTDASPSNKMISKRLQRERSAVDKLESGGKTRQHRRQQPPGASCADQTPAGQSDPSPKHTHQSRRNHEGDLSDGHQPEAYDDAIHRQGRETRPEGRTTSVDAREHIGALRQSGKRPLGTSSTDQAAAAAGGAAPAAPAAKRHRRSRESDANKPWWVV